jgi:hypothetical protein
MSDLAPLAALPHCPGHRVLLATLPPSLHCPVCTLKFVSPTRLDPCGHVVCIACVGDKQACPCCGAEVKGKKVDATASTMLYRYEMSSRARCTSCQWVGQSERFEGHHAVLNPPAQGTSPSKISNLRQLQATAPSWQPSAGPTNPQQPPPQVTYVPSVTAMQMPTASTPSGGNTQYYLQAAPNGQAQYVTYATMPNQAAAPQYYVVTQAPGGGQATAQYVMQAAQPQYQTVSYVSAMTGMQQQQLQQQQQYQQQQLQQQMQLQQQRAAAATPIASRTGSFYQLQSVSAQQPPPPLPSPPHAPAAPANTGSFVVTSGDGTTPPSLPSAPPPGIAAQLTAQPGKPLDLVALQAIWGGGGAAHEIPASSKATEAHWRATADRSPPAPTPASSLLGPRPAAGESPLSHAGTEAAIRRIMQQTARLAEDLSHDDHRHVVESAMRRHNGNEALAMNTALSGILSMQRFSSSKVSQGRVTEAEEWSGRTPSTVKSTPVAASPAASQAAPFASPAIASPSISKAASKPSDELYIFWDLDNIPIPPDQSARSVYTGILDHFVKQRIIKERHAVYTHVYFADGATTTHATVKVREDLRAMGCVLVVCTRRKEDADRQITTAIAQMTATNVTNPVAIISSDKDFTVTVQRLRRSGNEVYVIHDAMRNSEHEKLLEFAASGAWCIRGVVREWWNPNGKNHSPAPSNAAVAEGTRVFANGSTNVGRPGRGGAAGATTPPAPTNPGAPVPSNAVKVLLAQLQTNTSPDPQQQQQQAAPSDPISKLLAQLQQQKNRAEPSAAAPAHVDPAIINSAFAQSSSSSATATSGSRQLHTTAAPSPAVVSSRKDGQPVVLIAGAQCYSKFLERNDGLDDLLDRIGEPGVTGHLCPDGLDCQLARACKNLHFKTLRMSATAAYPTWTLVQSSALKHALDMQNGLVRLSEIPRFCTETATRHKDDDATTDLTCRHLHLRFLRVGNTVDVPLYALVYNNAVFEALRGEAVEWCDNLGDGHSASACFKIHARSVSLGKGHVFSARNFYHSEGLRAHLMQNLGPAKLCPGHAHTVPASEVAQCQLIHSKVINFASPREAIHLIEEPQMFEATDVAKSLQKLVPLCAMDHRPHEPCDKVHTRRPDWPASRY